MFTDSWAVLIVSREFILQLELHFDLRGVTFAEILSIFHAFLNYVNVNVENNKLTLQ